VFVDSLEILVFEPDGALLTSIRTAGDERAVMSVGGGDIFIRPIFGNERLFAVAGDRISLLDTASGLLTRLTPKGTIESRLKIVTARLGATADDREAFLEAMFPRDVEEGIAGRFYNAWRSVAMRDSLPVADALVGSADGSVWIGLYAKPGAASRLWVRRSKDGAMSAVELPAAVKVLDSKGDLVVGTRLDQLDRPSVHVYKLTL
jgi:hypothetical protein